MILRSVLSNPEIAPPTKPKGRARCPLASSATTVRRAVDLLARAFSAAGLTLPTLSREERARLRQQAAELPGDLQVEIARAARAAPEVERRAGVRGETLLRLFDQEDELSGLSRGVAVLQRQAAAGRRALHHAQREAQRRVLRALAQALERAELAGRLAILADAAPVIDDFATQLTERRDASPKEGRDRAELDEDLRLLRRLRALQSGAPAWR